MRYTDSAKQSKLIEIPLNAEPKQAFMVVQQNLDTIWKTIKDLIGRMDAQAK